MATFSIDIADADVARVTSAVCKGAGKDVSAANALAAITEFIAATIVNVEASEARAAALAAVAAPAAAPVLTPILPATPVV